MSTLERLTAALPDRYTLERELGQGRMATVYLATVPCSVMPFVEGESLRRLRLAADSIATHLILREHFLGSGAGAP